MKNKLNIIFMGSGLYGSLVLNSLDQSNFNILNIFTKSNKVISRNIKKQEYFNVESHDIPISEISKFSKEDLHIITKAKPDLIIVASFGLILPESMLSVPHYGVINIHPSLLPKYRGPSPLSSCIICIVLCPILFDVEHNFQQKRAAAGLVDDDDAFAE